MNTVLNGGKIRQMAPRSMCLCLNYLSNITQLENRYCAADKSGRFVMLTVVDITGGRQ